MLEDCRDVEEGRLVAVADDIVIDGLDEDGTTTVFVSLTTDAVIVVTVVGTLVLVVRTTICVVLEVIDGVWTVVLFSTVGIEVEGPRMVTTIFLLVAVVTVLFAVVAFIVVVVRTALVVLVRSLEDLEGG